MNDRPQQMNKPHVFCNFRQPVRARSKKKERAADRRSGMSEAHLKLIRQMPCCVSLYLPAGEAHHMKTGPAQSERGMGMRATDRWAVPLCHEKHMELESLGSRKELGWFRDHGIEDPYELANALWNETGDLPRMISILMAHRGK
jgi:hypothetical protein